VKRPDLIVGDDGLARCAWCMATPAYRTYHDTEWGVPVTDERGLFESLVLESFVAGLSWRTILEKRGAFRSAFAGFDPKAIAGFGPDDVERLLGDAAIVRHRGKIEATVGNARALLALHAAGSSLADLVRAHTPKPRSPRARITGASLAAAGIPAEATRLSKALVGHGFRFAGPTTVHAFLQATGAINDHVSGCHVRTSRGGTPAGRPGA
jgi:DNA-3-methyladenine glycosylase I